MQINIVNLERNVPDDGVTVAHWRTVLTQDDISVSAYGSVSLLPDPQSPDFVPFVDLTEEVVSSWVCAELDMTAIEASLQAQLSEKLTPSVVSGLPW